MGPSRHPIHPAQAVQLGPLDLFDSLRLLPQRIQKTVLSVRCQTDLPGLEHTVEVLGRVTGLVGHPHRHLEPLALVVIETGRLPKLHHPASFAWPLLARGYSHRSYLGLLLVILVLPAHHTYWFNGTPGAGCPCAPPVSCIRFASQTGLILSISSSLLGISDCSMINSSSTT